MNNTTISISRWWVQKRLQYNKGLFFTGLMGFVAESLQPCFIGDKMIIALLPEMQVSGGCLLMFLILANIAFTLGSILDLVFNNENSQAFRDRLFLGGYWFAITVLIAFMIAFLFFK